MQFFISFILAALILLFSSLQRTYSRVSLRELQRRARKNEPLAKGLYKASSYGPTLKTLLSSCAVITSAIFFWYVSRFTATWFSILASFFVLWFGYFWLPSSQVTKFGNWLAIRLAPIFAWLLQELHPLLMVLVKFVNKHRPVFLHTGVYEKEDLYELLDRQAVQEDNRLTVDEIKRLKSVLDFSDRKVIDTMTPKRMVQLVNADDSVSMGMLDALHKTGFSRFPVFVDAEDQLVGTVYVKDMVGQQAKGKVRDHMRPEVYYAHEDQLLPEILAAMIKLQHHLFVVVNSFEEFVGVITLEDILEALSGQQIVDEFDQYDNLRAVAEHVAEKEHKSHAHETKPKKDDKVTNHDQ